MSALKMLGQVVSSSKASSVSIASHHRADERGRAVNFSTITSQVPEITEVLDRTARDCTFVGSSMLVHVLPI